MVSKPEDEGTALRLEEVLKKLSATLRAPEKRRALQQLKDDHAQLFIDFLYTLLSHPSTLKSPEPWFRKHTLITLRKLSETSMLYPQCYVLKGIEIMSYEGGGGFCDIHKGRRRAQDLCLKVVRLHQKSDAHEILRAYAREAILWSQLDHPNIVPFYGIYYLNEARERICLVSPWMDNGNIVAYLKRYPDAPRKSFIYDIATGLEYLHRENIVHGDLKGLNVLVNQLRRACIADFGLSIIQTNKTLGYTNTTVAPSGHTNRWASPELLEDDSRPTRASDIWAFGCVCYEVLTRLLPFQECSTDVQVVRKLIRGDLPARPGNATSDPVDMVDETMWKLINHCWESEAAHRPSCQDIIQNLEAMMPIEIYQGMSRDHSAWEGERFRHTIERDSSIRIDLDQVQQILEEVYQIGARENEVIRDVQVNAEFVLHDQSKGASFASTGNMAGSGITLDEGIPNSMQGPYKRPATNHNHNHNHVSFQIDFQRGSFSKVEPPLPSTYETALPGHQHDTSSLEKLDGSATRMQISGPMNGGPIPAGFRFGTEKYKGKSENVGSSGGTFSVNRREKTRSRFWPGMWRGTANGEKQVVVVPRNVFGVLLEESLEVSQICGLPSVVFRSIEYLEAKKADQVEGIYRLSGNPAVIKKLTDRFNAEGDVNLLASDEYWDPHAIAGLLKSYLRELPASILTRDLHLRFLSVIDFVDAQERIRELSQLIASLPLANYSLLRLLTAHLILIVQNASVNKMTMRNVGIVFSPTLGIPAGILNLMLGEFNRVFNVDTGKDLVDGVNASGEGQGEAGDGAPESRSGQHSSVAVDEFSGVEDQTFWWETQVIAPVETKPVFDEPIVPFPPPPAMQNQSEVEYPRSFSSTTPTGGPTSSQKRGPFFGTGHSPVSDYGMAGPGYGQDASALSRQRMYPQQQDIQHSGAYHQIRKGSFSAPPNLEPLTWQDFVRGLQTS